MQTGRVHGGSGRLRSVLGSAYWRADDARVVVDAWRASGLSQAEFARRHGFHVRRLRRWRRWLEEAAPEPSVASLVPVTVVDLAPGVGDCEGDGGDSTMEVVLDDVLVVRLGAGFDADALRRLLDVLAC